MMAACSCCQLTASCCSSSDWDGLDPDCVSEPGNCATRRGGACLTTSRSCGSCVAALLHGAPVSLLNLASSPVCGSKSQPGTDGNCAGIVEAGGTSFPIAPAGRESLNEAISCPACVAGVIRFGSLCDVI